MTMTTEEARRAALENLLLYGNSHDGKERVCLWELAGLHDADALETGTHTAVATIAIARGLRPGRKVYTFDPRWGYLEECNRAYDDPKWLKICQANLWLCGLEDGEIVKRYACDVAEWNYVSSAWAGWKPDGQPKLGLAFIDGWHSKEACQSDLEMVWPWIVPGGHVAVHDNHMSGVIEALAGFLDRHGDARQSGVVKTITVLKKETE